MEYYTINKPIVKYAQIKEQENNKVTEQNKENLDIDFIRVKEFVEYKKLREQNPTDFYKKQQKEELALILEFIANKSKEFYGNRVSGFLTKLKDNQKEQITENQKKYFNIELLTEKFKKVFASNINPKINSVFEDAYSINRSNNIVDMFDYVKKEITESKKAKFQNVLDVIHNPESEVHYIGAKEPEKRIFNKFKLGIASVVATLGMSSFTVGDLYNKNIDQVKETSNIIGVVKKDNSKTDLTDYSEAIKILEETLEKEVIFDPNKQTIRDKYPTVNFNVINNARDLAREFVGVDNFIALAAEMEGFRGDIHKDPAVGLNLGFGYNITKRVQANVEKVQEDLSSIGLAPEVVEELISISQVPQKRLNKEIKKFNEKHKLTANKNQLISLEQGAALLDITKKEYQEDAKMVFSSSFNKMPKHQQEVLTYITYKAGAAALSQYSKAIRAAKEVFSKKGEPTVADLGKVAKEFKFYYRKDGQEFVLDERAVLIANSFQSQDFLAKEVGAYKKVNMSSSLLNKYRISYNLENENSAKVAFDNNHNNTNTNYKNQDFSISMSNIASVLDNLRNNHNNENINQINNRPKLG